jgi:cell division protein FtsX
VLTRATAERVGLGIGDELSLAGWCTGDGDPVELSEPIDLVVTGVSVGPFDVEPPGSGQTIEPTYVDQTVVDALYTGGAEFSTYHAVWLLDGSTADVTRELDGYDSILDLAEQTAILDAALDADARPQWILAAFGALTGLLLLAPIIDRSIRDDTDDVATLVALGSPRSQVGLLAVSHVVVLAAAGVLMAVGVAPLFAAMLPIGLAGKIVTERVWFDAVVTGLGIVLLCSAVAAIAALSTWRLMAGPRARRPVTGVSTGRAVGSLRLRPPAQTGAMAALGRPAGRRLASPWPGLVSLVLACTVCVAGLTYVSGLRNLEQSPQLLGWNWDVAVALDSDADGVEAQISQFEGVEQATSGTLWPPVFLSTPGSDLQIWPWSFATGPGAITPTMVEGRAPEGPDEVAIDLVFRDLTGLAPGDTVQLQRPSLSVQLADQLQHAPDPDVVIERPDDQPVVATFEITGIAVLSLERTNLFPQTSFTLAGLAAFVEPSADEVEATSAWLPVDLPAEMRDLVDQVLSDPGAADGVVYLRTSGDSRRVAAGIGELEGVAEVMAPRPLDVLTLVNALNLSGTDNVPLALATLAAVAALALGIYLLATGMWARRTELAVLRAVGLSSWGVRSSLAAQATSTVVVVLAVSVPVGVAIGQWAWLGYARDLLVVPEATVPWAGLAALLVGALVAVNAVAMIAAQLTVRRSASRELRAE